MKKIPEKFYRTHLRAPEVKTVGGLIKALEELPKSLPFTFGLCEEKIRVVVYNHGEEEMHASLEEIEE